MYYYILYPKMPHTWIDERPLEEIIQTTVPHPRFDALVDDVLLRIDIDAQFQYKLYKNTNNVTIYDTDIIILTAKLKQLERDYKEEDTRFQKLCESYGELAVHDTENTGSSNTEEEEEEELEDNNVEDKLVGQKDFIAVKKTAAHGKELQKILLQIKQIKAQMADRQQKLMNIQGEITILQTNIEAFQHYQYADRIYFSFMRKLILLFEKNKDQDFLKKGIYCILQYRDMMRKRYVSKEPCEVNDKNYCSNHFLPIIENKLCSLVV